MATREIGDASAVSARLDLFDTRNRGSAQGAADDETGWALALAGRHRLGQMATLKAEWLHVSSDKAARARAGLTAEQRQDQLQLALAVRW